jgi:hypothetical protein
MIVHFQILLPFGWTLLLKSNSMIVYFPLEQHCLAKGNTIWARYVQLFVLHHLNETIFLQSIICHLYCIFINCVVFLYDVLVNIS